MRDLAPAGFRPLLELESGHLRSIIRHARRLRYLTSHLHALIGDPTARHCVVANETGEQIVIVADSPVWASKLRYQMPELERHFAQTHENRNRCSIRITVAPPEITPKAPVSRPNVLSDKNAGLIKDMAEALGDGHLRESLMRLAKRGKD